MTRLLLLLALTALPFSLHAEDKTSGQGDWKFKFRPDLSTLPDGAEEHIKKAHGGFAVDRQGDGDIYFHLDGYGIIHLSPDLTEIKKIEGDEEFTAGNGHNTSLGYNDGEPFLVMPDNKRGVVLYADTKGKLLHKMERPDVLDWFVGSKFAPTDTLVVDDQLLVADGYGSKYIFPADLFGDYTKGIHGGSSIFTTSHGLDLNPVTGQIAIADRGASLIRYFDKEGNEIKDGKNAVVTELPKGALPCDVDYMPDGTAVIGCLRGAGGETGEIYILDPDGKVLSVLNPKKDLGLDNGILDFQHVHNASWTKVGDTVFLLAYAWNPGAFAVLERVAE